MASQIEPTQILNLTVGLLRTEVFRRLGLPLPKVDYGKGLIGKLSKALLGAEVNLDKGPGYVNTGVIRAFPSLNLRASLGVEIFFDSNYRLKSVWYEPPFPSHVWGINFGDSLSTVVSKRGEPQAKKMLSESEPRYFVYDIGNNQAVKVEFMNYCVNLIAYGTRAEL